MEITFSKTELQAVMADVIREQFLSVAMRGPVVVQDIEFNDDDACCLTVCFTRETGCPQSNTTVRRDGTVFHEDKTL